MRALPGVRSVGATSALPFQEDRIDIEAAVSIEGKPVAEGEAPAAYAAVATPGYFPTMGIALRRGRPLAATDAAGTPPVAVVNEAFVRHFFPGEDPIGGRFTAGVMGRPVAREIVGVVADVKQARIEAAPRPEFFVPHAQSGVGSMTLVVNTTGDAAALRSAVERELWALAPTLAVYDFATIDGLIDTTVAERRFGVLLVGGLALLALVLAAVGIYGVVSVTTRERTHEFGVRLALGAQARDVLALTLGEGLRLAAIGVAVGALGAAALAAIVRSRLYGVTPGDPLTYAAVTGTLMGVALIACWLPARRAARVDPVQVLRGE